MRKIKFRVYDPEIKQMCICVDTAWGDVPEPSIVYDAPDGERYSKNQKNIHLMQYTGLEDKNGKEIYEGDIVWSSKQTGEVFYGPDNIGKRAEFAVRVNENYYVSLVAEIPNNNEVLGNIYENPELLKTNTAS